MIYNMTTEDKTYGNAMLSIVIPASEEAGTRGPGVAIDVRVKLAVFLAKDQFQADLAAGLIQLEN